jgi:hypothetical protein
VAECLSTPCWWMPDSCAKALAPTMALLGWTEIPVYDATILLVRMIWRVSMSLPHTQAERVSGKRRTNASEREETDTVQEGSAQRRRRTAHRMRRGKAQAQRAR